MTTQNHHTPSACLPQARARYEIILVSKHILAIHVLNFLSMEYRKVLTNWSELQGHPTALAMMLHN